MLTAVVVALMPASAQRGTAATVLTADDHVQIQQLVARFGYALDTGANDGAMFADLFAADGSFGAVKSRAQLLALARSRSGGAANRHFVSNVIIRRASAAPPARRTKRCLPWPGRPAECDRAHRALRGHVHEDDGGWRIQTRDVLPVDHDARGREGGGTPGARVGRPAAAGDRRAAAHQRAGHAHGARLPRDPASRGWLRTRARQRVRPGRQRTGLRRAVCARRCRLPAPARLRAAGGDRARTAPRPALPRHFLTNVTIAPSPEGATASNISWSSIRPKAAGRAGCSSAATTKTSM